MALPRRVGWNPVSTPVFGQLAQDLAFYTAIDKYRPAPARHVSDVVSATLSLRPIDHFDVRLLWHRIVTDYNRDADILLLGLGYRF